MERIAADSRQYVESLLDILKIFINLGPQSSLLGLWFSWVWTNLKPFGQMQNRFCMFFKENERIVKPTAP
jgi:hypothetical protein